ncbi:protein commissureless 2 homolog [Anopheles gambiae]|uniref:protein commissureless 2 homolog n=1 Tax=Anopheles gambiae TaxID=7165 RepID=UPI002AC8E327|nr:protein commissureless 2 homolog [Anopheles gambiae]
MIENFESKITFEIPTNLDFDKLIRGNNYTLFWQNLHQQQQQQHHYPGTVASGAAARLAAVGTAGASAATAAAAATFGGMGSDGGGSPFGGGFGSSGSSLFGGIDYSNGSSDYGLLNSLQTFANRGRDGLGVGPGTEQMLDPTYERFIGDVWVGIVLTLMILSSIFCMCSCFLYHKFRQWQRNVLTARSQTLSSMDIETPPPYDAESLPSYTIVSGLPSYQDAIEQLKQKQMKYYEPVKVHRPSVMKLFESQDLLSQSAAPPATSAAQPTTAKLEEIRYNFVRPLSVQDGVGPLPEATTSSSIITTTGPTVLPAGSSQHPAASQPLPPPPPYKSQISTISTASSTGAAGVGGVVVGSMVVELPAQHAPVVPMVTTTVRLPQKKPASASICQYTIEHERPAAGGARS